jgi:hypothetical protein
LPPRLRLDLHFRSDNAPDDSITSFSTLINDSILSDPSFSTRNRATLPSSLVGIIGVSAIAIENGDRDDAGVLSSRMIMFERISIKRATIAIAGKNPRYAERIHFGNVNDAAILIT